MTNPNRPFDVIVGMSRTLILAIPLLALPVLVCAAGPARRIAIENNAGLELVRVAATPIDYKGQKALQLVGVSDGSDGDQVALVKDLDFKDGTIEVDLAGVPGPAASNTARGFVGVAFRAAPHAAAIDCFYLRPTNGRADDQERRNHVTQYISHPEWTWSRLRKETPSRYESYVDMVPNTWTRIKIDVSGARASLYVHDQPQPVLIVNDVKTGAQGRGGVGLWVGSGTVAHFRNVRVQPAAGKAGSPLPD